MTREQHEAYLINKLKDVLERLDVQHEILLGTNISAQPLFEAKITLKLIKDFDGFYMLGKEVDNG